MMENPESYLLEQSLRIKEKLKRLKKIDKSFDAFGASIHKYELNTVLKEEKLFDFESEYKITLPKEFRAFLKYVGNGGAGPFYGLERIENAIWSDLDRKGKSKLVNPSLPFPHTEPQMINFELYEFAGEFDENKFEEEWYNPKHTQGILRLSNYGCGVFIDLVVNGEEYGNMWTSDVVNDAGIFPSGMLENEPERINFLDWYELWLDDSLQKMESNNYEKPVSPGFSGQGFGGIKKFLRKYFRL